MQALRRFALLAATASPLLLLGLGSTADERATSRFQHSGRMPVEETAAVTQADFFSEAPTGFDNLHQRLHCNRARRSTRSTRTTS